ncbi:O-antigen polymerase [Carnobacterium sp. ISL-102]|uniref:O-antigen polymerase n=1 Tax=Carnobacterium sp. ISL-102 TaxID=2819142 RepID=UPI001BE6E755|nr:O-antigen polymerase [Carnobacterium sp. ISL-102]MBT2731068.1 oligosaccharide repeat unit polymerase [Carnobacterium sp. ISL-102]
MIYILLFTLVILLLIYFFIFKIDWLSPTIIFTITYIASLSILIINAKEWGISLSGKTFFVIIAGIIVLSFGEIFARFFYQEKTKKSNFEKKSKEIEIIIPSKRGTNFIIIYMFLILGWYFIHIRSTVASVGMFEQTLFGAYRSTEEDLNIILQMALTINLPIVYYYLLSVIEQFMFQNILNKKNILPIIIFFVTSALSSGRMDILYLLISIVTISYIVYQNKTTWKLNFSIKMFNKIIFAILMFFAIFYLLGFLTGKSNENSFYYTISLYVGSSIAALDYFLNSFEYNTNNFGNETLIGINNLLELIGINVNFANERILDFVHLGNMPSRTNIYTSYRRVINDYGYIGMLVYQFLVGFFYSIFYQKIKKKRWKNQKFGILLYVYLLRYLIFSFTEERILINVFTTTTIIQLLVFLFLIKLSTTRVISPQISSDNN